jgi:hypothetical protein
MELRPGFSRFGIVGRYALCPGFSRPKGKIRKKSGDWTLIEHFLAGVQRWNAGMRRILPGHSGCVAQSLPLAETSFPDRNRPIDWCTDRSALLCVMRSYLMDPRVQEDKV